MDEMDLAQELTDRQLALTLHDHQAARPIRESATHCVDCDEPIPAARREAAPGCLRCIDCQTLLEHWSALP